MATKLIDRIAFDYGKFKFIGGSTVRRFICGLIKIRNNR